MSIGKVTIGLGVLSWYKYIIVVTGKLLSTGPTERALLTLSKGWFTIWRKVLRLTLCRDASMYARIDFWSILVLRCIAACLQYDCATQHNAMQDLVSGFMHTYMYMYLVHMYWYCIRIIHAYTTWRAISMDAAIDGCDGERAHPESSTMWLCTGTAYVRTYVRTTYMPTQHGELSVWMQLLVDVMERESPYWI